jgi:hypothetical protein
MSAWPTYVRDDHFLSTNRQPVNQALNATPSQKSGGSREHYYHFLLGYLLPLVHEQEKRQLPYFRVLECGPLMTPILNRTLSSLGYRYEITRNEAIEEPIILEKWDYTWHCDDAANTAIQRVKDAWATDSCCQGVEADNLLLVRSEPPSYYINGQAEIQGYGTSRREITNWRAIQDHLDASGIHATAYEPGCHSLGCQIRAFQRAKKVVGIRGAEWANIVWSDELDVLIFDPHPPATTLLSLLRRKKTTYHFHYIDQERCAINPGLIYDYLLSKDQPA